MVETYLKEISLFSNLDDSEIGRIAELTRKKRFASGEVIMQEGQEGDTMYIVLEGELEVSKTLTMKFGEDDYREKEKLLTRYFSQDHPFFGKMALIGRYQRSATIVAVTDCLLLEISRSDFMKFLEGFPAIGNKLLLKISESLIKRLRRSSQDVVRLSTALSIALSR